MSFSSVVDNLLNKEHGRKEDEFTDLVEQAHKCRLCPQVFHKLTYLNRKNGDLESPIMFIGEAPGFVRDRNERLMAFHGNQSGFNFEDLLKSIGLTRSSVYVTNALLHSPIKESRTHYPDYGYITIRPPKTQELINCSHYLKRQIEIVNPTIVCTLGRAALEAIKILERHSYNSVPQGINRPIEWFGRWLYPLYHTSPNVTAGIRPYSKMEEDFQLLREFAESIGVVNIFQEKE